MFYRQTDQPEIVAETSQVETNDQFEGKPAQQLQEMTETLRAEIAALETQIDEAAGNDDFDEADRITAIQEGKQAELDAVDKYLSENPSLATPTADDQPEPEKVNEQNSDGDKNSGNDDVEDKIIKNISEA